MDATLDKAEPGQVVILGFGRVGRMVADMLESHGKDYLAIDSDVDGVAASRKEGYDVLYGDVSRPGLIEQLRERQPSAFILTMDNPVLAGRLARNLRGAFPDLPIVARARDTAHAAELYKAGATDAVPETLEASLQLAEAALVDLGVAMGPVIASIHEKRDELRAEIKAEAEMAEAPRLGGDEQAEAELVRQLDARRATFSSALLGPRRAARAPWTSGPAALGHVGAAAAALPAQRRDRGLDQIDRADLIGEVVGDSDSDAGAAVVDRDQGGDARTDALLHRVNGRAQVLGIEAFDDLAEEGMAADLLGPGQHRISLLRRPSPAPSSRRPARARAACAPRPGPRPAPAPRRAQLLSAAAASRSRESRSFSHRRAASPVSASIRRTPEDTALSETILSNWMSPSARTWVPPHSSTE